MQDELSFRCCLLVTLMLSQNTICMMWKCESQDAVRALKARLTDTTAALQISHSEALRLRTRVADLKAAVSVSSLLCL